MHRKVLLLAAAAGVADAFMAPMAPGAPKLSMRRQGATSLSMSIKEEKKVGTGNNRMTDTGFTEPLVERVEYPSSHGFEYVVKDVLNEKKFSKQEKVKKEKPGMSIFDELETLAAEARRVGGADKMVGFEADVNVRLKWLGLFHRDVIAPGTFMQRFRVPNGKMTAHQWRTSAEIIQEYDQDKNRDMWDQQGCADITTRQNLQLRGMRLENMPRHWKAMRDTGISSVQAGTPPPPCPLLLAANRARVPPHPLSAALAAPGRRWVPEPCNARLVRVYTPNPWPHENPPHTPALPSACRRHHSVGGWGIMHVGSGVVDAE